MQFDMRPRIDSESFHGCHVCLKVVGRNSKQVFTTEVAQECRKQLDRMVVTFMVINPTKCIIPALYEHVLVGPARALGLGRALACFDVDAHG